LAAYAALVSTATAGFAAWRYLYRDRLRLRVVVNNWDREDPMVSAPCPDIIVRNVGGRTAYVTGFEFVERNKNRIRFTGLLNQELEPGKRLDFHPDWSPAGEDTDPVLAFQQSWKGLRIAAIDGTGRRWTSRPICKDRHKGPSWHRVSIASLDGHA
jgi:hypothetical protein